MMRVLHGARPVSLALLSMLLASACSRAPESATTPSSAPTVAGTPAAGDRPMGRGGPGPVLVVTALPEMRSFGTEIESVGTALARESVEITSKVSNTVTAIRFAEGQLLRRGMVMVELDRAQAAAALAEAEANLAESRNQFNRGRDLSVTQALSRAQLDQLETAVKTGEARVAAARARLGDTIIRAPFDGRAGFRRVSLGGLVNPGAVITTLDDASVIKLEFSVPQAFLGELRAGLPVAATTDGLPGRVFAGKVSTIDSRVDPVTRSIAVRAELPNPAGELRPGMFMSVKLRGRETPTLIVPEEAIVPEQGKTYVYVTRDGKAERREVRTGGRQPGVVAVLSGLSTGDRIVVDGTLRLRDGAAIAEAPPAPRQDTRG